MKVKEMCKISIHIDRLLGLVGFQLLSLGAVPSTPTRNTCFIRIVGQLVYTHSAVSARIGCFGLECLDSSIDSSVNQ